MCNKVFLFNTRRHQSIVQKRPVNVVELSDLGLGPIMTGIHQCGEEDYSNGVLIREVSGPISATALSL